MKRPSGLLGGITTFTSWTMASRCLGLLRDIIIVSSLGAGWRFDAFAIALKIPNTFRSFTAEGALTSAFVPVFTRESKRHGPEQARLFFGQVLIGLVICLGLLCCFAVAKPGLLITVFAPGLDQDGATFLLATDLIRITFPYIVLISATAIFGGVLSANGHFSAFAVTSALFNLCLIAAAGFATWFELSLAHILAWGVSISGLCQLALVIAAAFKCGVMPRLRPTGRKAPFRAFLLAFGPALLGASVIQINSIIDLMIASTLEIGSISILFVAERLYQLPIGLIGASLGVAILPLLANRFSDRNATSAHQALNDGIVFSVLLALPAACGLIVLALPIFKILFEHGHFVAADSQKAALALQIFAVSLPAAIINKCLLACFYASRDTARPAWIAAAAVVVNTAISYSLSLRYGYIGVAIGTSVSIWFQFVLFVTSLYRRKLVLISSDLLNAALKIGLATAAMIAGLIGLKAVLPYSGSESDWAAAGVLSVHIGIGASIYLFCAYRFGFLSLLTRMRKTPIVQT